MNETVTKSASAVPGAKDVDQIWLIGLCFQIVDK